MIKQIWRKLFKKEETAISNSNPITFKMWEHNGWGDSIYWCSFVDRRVSGHLTPIPKEGDLLQCKMESGKIGVYRFKEIDYCHNPHDMFFATMEDVGYLDEITEKGEKK